MSRALFRAWGAQLPQQTFAKAVASVGVLGPQPGALEQQAIDDAGLALRNAGRDIAVLRTEHLARLVGSLAGGAPPRAAQDYVAAWDRFTSTWFYELPPSAPLLRLEVDAEVEPALRASAPDSLWLLRLLLRHEVGHSAYLRVDEPDRAVAWELPLRIGVLGDARSAELAEHVAAVPWPQLVRLVPLSQVDEDCDLLLLADDLRGAVARVLRQPRRLRADCVLAIGGAGVAAERIMPLAAALRAEVLTAGVGIARIDPERGREWLIRLIEELSHDNPLDVALVGASRSVQGDEDDEPAFLFTSRRLATAARVTAFARRLGQEVRRMATARAAPPAAARPRFRGPARQRAARPPSTAPIAPASPLPPPPTAPPAIEAAAAELEARANSGAFMHESGDASVIAGIRADVEARIGGQLVAPREGAAETVERPHDERRVNFTVTDVTGAAPVKVEDRLEADHAYEMALYIGLPQRGVESAPERFPSERLPPSRNGHLLDVFFVPLVRTGSGRLHTPQQARLFLPPQGDSEPCSISFRTHGVRDEYRARVLITHENRVIQTLLFSSPLGASTRRFALDVENVVAPSFDPAWQGKAFDAAIVVNHTSDGQAGFTTIVGREVSFREPQGIDTLIGQVKRLLSAEATFPDARGTLDDPALLKLFDDLARYGRSILKPMPPELQGRVPEGARIQVVEARSGAWLPVEIFYSERLPKAGATLCPRAGDALLRKDGASHESCPHRDDRDHHCPLRFWGFSCVIERQPPLSPAAGADYTISVPRPGADHLEPLRAALVGASNKVRAQDLTEPGGIVDAVRQVVASARTVKGWEEWESAVEADSPSLLMLLPHSQEDPAHPGITGLEIGGALLTYPELESSYVAGPAAKAPVVLLLGCSTQLTDVPFLNFVEAFKREKAALVVGTLATIRGRRTVAFVSALLEGLKSAAGSERSFGDVFLETKRRLLAGGDGFVLSLTAYGDVGWRL